MPSTLCARWFRMATALELAMATTSPPLQISGLDKRKFATLRGQATALGLSTEAYALQLIEEGIVLERRARTETFDQLFAPVQERFRSSKMSEPELGRLVKAARARQQKRLGRKKG